MLMHTQERGQAEPNFVEDHLGQIKTPTDEYHLKMAAASLYSGRFLLRMTTSVTVR